MVVDRELRPVFIAVARGDSRDVSCGVRIDLPQVEAGLIGSGIATLVFEVAHLHAIGEAAALCTARWCARTVTGCDATFSASGRFSSSFIVFCLIKGELQFDSVPMSAVAILGSLPSNCVDGALFPHFWGVLGTYSVTVA